MRANCPGGVNAALTDVVTKIVRNAVDPTTKIRWFRVLDLSKICGMNDEVRRSDLVSLTGGSGYEVIYNEMGRDDRDFKRYGTHIATLSCDPNCSKTTDVKWKDISKVDARARPGYDKLTELLDF